MAGAARPLAACLFALAAALAVVLAGAVPAKADAVRQQEMWVLNAIHAPQAWQTTRGQGVKIALIDSGVNVGVSDLAGSVTEGPDLTRVGTSPSNSSWGVHGTWMASLIAGHGHAGGGSSGIIGVAPESQILSIRVVTDQGDPGFRHYEHERDASVQRALARAIRYAISHRSQVISMSLGYGAPSLPVREALQRALDKGIVVVASSGNSGDAPSAHRHGHAPYSYPADYPGVLGVGAVGQNGRPASFSSDNLSVQVAAPGVRVPAQGRDGQYWLVSGTSPACALTAGVAALIKAKYPHLAPALVVQAITQTAQHQRPGRYNDRVGFGTVDASAALTAAGRLAHDNGTGRGASLSARFGGGPAAIPPVPVPPRGRSRLYLYGLLGLAGLLLAAGTAVRLLTRRRRTGELLAGAGHGDGFPGRTSNRGWAPPEQFGSAGQVPPQREPW
jgi:type VII secretion-associated serine protease mycosin